MNDDATRCRLIYLIKIIANCIIRQELYLCALYEFGIAITVDSFVNPDGLRAHLGKYSRDLVHHLDKKVEAKWKKSNLSGNIRLGIKSWIEDENSFIADQEQQQYNVDNMFYCMLEIKNLLGVDLQV